jgi:hypothetical protein
VNLPEIGKALVAVGLVMAVLGAVLWLAGGKGWLSWLGQLPGDIRIERETGSFHFPIVTCLVLSLLLTFLLNLFFRR